MRIDEREVRHLAALAALELNESEVERMRDQLSAILDYIDQLRDVSTTPEDSAPATLDRDALAADVPVASLDRDVVERNAPAFAHGHFVVPKVIGGE